MVEVGVRVGVRTGPLVEVRLGVREGNGGCVGARVRVEVVVGDGDDTGVVDAVAESVTTGTGVGLTSAALHALLKPTIMHIATAKNTEGFIWMILSYPK
jgi:hypothetical protein